MDLPHTGVGGWQPTDEGLTGNHEYDPFIKSKQVEDNTKVIEIKIFPQEGGGGSNPYIFTVPADPYRFTNLRNIRIRGQLRVVDTENREGEIANTEIWSLCNNYGHAIFSDIQATIGESCVIGDSSLMPYPYKSYVETLLNYSNEYKEKVLRYSGWCEDEAGKGNTFAFSNEAFKNRRYGIATSGWHPLDLLLHTDLVSCEKHLPPDYKLGFRLKRTSSDFVLLQPKENKKKYDIELRNIHICLERRENQEKLQEWNRHKNTEITEIPLSRNLIRCYNFSEGETDLSSYNLISSSALPETVYIFFVSQNAFNGSTEHNPFWMKKLKWQQACLNVNSTHEPTHPLNTTDTDHELLQTYHYFLENTGNSQRDSICNSITFEKWKNGYMMLAWDRTPGRTNRARRYKMDSGTLGTLLKLDTPLDENVVMILYCTYGSKILMKGTTVETLSF